MLGLSTRTLPRKAGSWSLRTSVTPFLAQPSLRSLPSNTHRLRSPLRRTLQLQVSFSKDSSPAGANVKYLQRQITLHLRHQLQETLAPSNSPSMMLISNVDVVFFRACANPVHHDLFRLLCVALSFIPALTMTLGASSR
mmetsp:Transcript_29374/g.89861  ORF Transcript_29374/g.89861 Transcript_29374/m.89861 type:complete len:139 (+) Transcript_29374:1318-1734(+)